jgi:hypothetical protein
MWKCGNVEMCSILEKFRMAEIRSGRGFDYSRRPARLPALTVAAVKSREAEA